ncbi:MAG: DUF58 domain-containing protein [Acidobacteria bacterium]|nr:DUF58 domain-containing protein [Acidobacteriota bacterium]
MKTFWQTSRSRSDGATEHGRWHLPFSFSITPAGWCFILGVFLLLLAALHTGNNLLILLISTMLSAVLTSGVFARSSLRSVLVTLQIPENVFEGEQVSVRVSVQNQKRLFPTLSITVEDLASENGGAVLKRLQRLRKSAASAGPGRPPDRSVLRHPAYFPWIPPRCVRSELVFQKYPRRGVYQLEGFRILTRYPFGLFARGERVSAKGRVWVYPSIHEVSSYYHLLPFPPGRMESARTGHGESLFAIRPYRDGESARLVDWKATAKTGRLMSREFARDEENTFCLILDTTAGPDSRPDDFEKAVSLAASFAWHFAKEEAEYQFLSPQRYVPAGIGTEHLYEVLRALAVVGFEQGTSPNPPDLVAQLGSILEPATLERLMSDKVLKIIITSRARHSFPSTAWQSAHVLCREDL